MEHYILCPECGDCLGRYASFVEEARKVLQAKQLADQKIDESKLETQPGAVPPLEPIFDALEISLRCCRMHLLTRVDFSKWAKNPG
jgi:DNA-directed RNA polymerase subunit N (RpoN/RPB10)